MKRVPGIAPCIAFPSGGEGSHSLNMRSANLTHLKEFRKTALFKNNEGNKARSPVVMNAAAPEGKPPRRP
jgi:hypothetical protein